MVERIRIILPVLFFLGIWASGCINPFAPGESDEDPLDDILGDPTTVEGFYQRFKSSYELRDTSLYGPLLHSDFEFSFRDEDENVDVTWSRTEDMTSTHNLFMQALDIQLQWSNFITIETNEDKTRTQAIRRFDLSVLLENNERLHTDGSANFTLVRPDSTQPWELISWRDESEI